VDIKIENTFLNGEGDEKLWLKSSFTPPLDLLALEFGVGFRRLELGH
jgi:hypothetical protein